jgi:Leucine-rich repeat (LRR) protein
LGLRENDLLAIPREVGELTRLRELHIQNNRLTVLPPEVGKNIIIAFNFRKFISIIQES